MSEPNHDQQHITHRVVEALRRIIRAIEVHSRALIHSHGLTGPQLIVLRAIADRPEAPLGVIARAVHLSQATVTGIVDRLESHHLVARVRSTSDKRVVHVCLTSEGSSVLARTPPLLQEHFMRGLTQLPDWEQSQILSSLQRVVALMEARSLDAASILTTGPIGATAEETSAFLDLGGETAEDSAAGSESASHDAHGRDGV